GFRGGPGARGYGSFRHDHFFVAPRYAPFYPGVPVWSYGLYDWDWPYYGRYYNYWPETLPTQDMIQRALPEGAIAPNGYVSGFVFFPALRSGNQYPLTMTMTVTDMDNNQQLGTIKIPLVVR